LQTAAYEVIFSSFRAGYNQGQLTINDVLHCLFFISLKGIDDAQSFLGYVFFDQTLFSHSIAVVLKRVPPDSLREEFLIPGRKIVPGRNWGGKAVDEKTLEFLLLV